MARVHVLVGVLLTCGIGAASCQSQEAADRARLERRYQAIQNDVTLFYSYRCQYCRQEMAFLESVQGKYQAIRFNLYETTRPENQANRELFAYAMERLDSIERGVPRTVVNGKVFIGFLEGDCDLSFNEVYRAYNGCETQIVAEIDRLAGLSAADARQPSGTELGRGVVLRNLSLFVLVPLYLLSLYFYKDKLTTPQNRRYWWAGLFALVLVCVVLFLLLTPQSQILRAVQSMPFPAFVFVIAIVDGFNPCSFSILIIFLSLLTYTRSRRDMYLVGLTFIITSAAVYGALILSMMMLTSLIFTRYEDIVGKALGVIVLILGLVNAKELVVPGKGPSLSVSDEKRTAIVRRFGRIVELLKERSVFGTVLGLVFTIALSVGVNLIELGCTAILPAVYMTSVLRRFGSSLRASHVLWTAVYAAVYVLPLAVILANFVVTFRSRRLTQRQGRTLKIVGGFAMIAFALVMILKPELLSFA
jgi:hypothetical protein